MKTKSKLIVLCSVIVMTLTGCAKQLSVGGFFDSVESSSTTYSSEVSSNTSEQVSEPTASVSSNESAAPITTGNSSNTSSALAELGIEAAKAVALEHAGIAAADATFTEAKLEYDDGIAEYDIEFIANAKHYEYEIRATDGAVLEFSSEAIPEPTGLISEARAKELALAHFGFSEEQVTFTKCKLDYDNGITEYEIEFKANSVEYELDLNAKTGEILKSEIDKD